MQGATGAVVMGLLSRQEPSGARNETQNTNLDPTFTPLWRNNTRVFIRLDNYQHWMIDLTTNRHGQIAICGREGKNPIWWPCAVTVS